MLTFFVMECAAAPLGETKYEASNMLNCKVSLWEGDITTLEIDAIVNAARPSLYPGQGGMKMFQIN